MNRKQIAVIGLVVVLMGLLLSLDIKGLVKEEDHSAEVGETKASVLTIESASETGKQSLNANLAQQISDLENQLKSADATEKLNLQKQLAAKWDDVNQPAPGAFYFELLAKAGNNYSDWIKAGDLFTDAYQSEKDSLIQPALVQKAIESYQKALELQSGSLDAKTGLGVAYVSGTPNPMQGITLLLEVVKQDPKNVKANLNLGLFSIKSGQFDKAVNRFKTVIEVKPTPDAWFYLASAYENLGQKGEAITAYEKSKELAADPNLTRYVDGKIQELKK
ncbi:tetratricopeptide repeat protein [Pedobacter sp. P351]|uniref:tetratricopeptide repeat protein n=1 Tax=Pedobacter superstes TaxID=3133441 RepID=UPI0030B2869B